VVKIGDTVYVAGQTPVDAHGQLVGKGDIEVQARQVFENIGKCLEAAGCAYEHVVKLNIYSTDIDAHLGPVAQIRNDYFPHEPVANTCVQVQRLVHPDWLLEIEAVAVLD
ncbi:MAG: RidA family protein, partial [Nitrospinota bacterium]|nr:RidA family protein [Nitrospinota bacterium]